MQKGSVEGIKRGEILFQLEHGQYIRPSDRSWRKTEWSPREHVGQGLGSSLPVSVTRARFPRLCRKETFLANQMEVLSVIERSYQKMNTKRHAECVIRKASLCYKEVYEEVFCHLFCSTPYDTLSVGRPVTSPFRRLLQFVLQFFWSHKRDTLAMILYLQSSKVPFESKQTNSFLNSNTTIKT